MNHSAGTPIENNLIWLSKDIPAWSSTVLPWSCPGDSKTQKIIFEFYAFKMNHYLWTCVSSREGVSSPFYCMFSKPLWMEFNLGRYKHGSPIFILAFFTDQFHNKSYICDVWKTSLGLTLDENGLITRHEIKTKI